MYYERVHLTFAHATREQERAARNFVLADHLRELLRAKGVEPNDKQGTYTLADGTTRPYPRVA